MRLRGPGPVLALVVLVGMVGVVGCGSDEPVAPEIPPETVDELAKLPDGWRPYVNHRAGFAIGRPPGWRTGRRGRSTLLMSPDRLVAVSISADRTTEAIEFPLDDYTLEATEALTGFKDFEVGKARPFKAHYEAEAVEATGTAKGGVRQGLQLIAMRRDAIATYAVLIARNVEKQSGFYGREALRMVRTLRGRPIG